MILTFKTFQELMNKNVYKAIGPEGGTIALQANLLGIKDVNLKLITVIKEKVGSSFNKGTQARAKVMMEVNKTRPRVEKTRAMQQMCSWKKIQPNNDNPLSNSLHRQTQIQCTYHVAGVINETKGNKPNRRHNIQNSPRVTHFAILLLLLLRIFRQERIHESSTTVRWLISCYATQLVH